MAIAAGFIAAVMGAFARGQRQAKRWPARRPTGLLIAAALLGSGAVGLCLVTVAEGTAHGSEGAMLTSAVMGLVALGVLASEAAAWRRLLARSRRQAVYR